MRTKPLRSASKTLIKGQATKASQKKELNHAHQRIGSAPSLSSTLIGKSTDTLVSPIPPSVPQAH